MGAPYPNAVLDTIEIASQGCHSGVDPKMLPDNQLWFAVNVTDRGGHPQSRPPYRKIALTFSGESETPATEAIFQDAAFYEARSGKNCFLASIGGRVIRYLISNESATVDDVSIAGDLNDPTSKQAWLFQGEEFMVINDGKALPLFFDGASLRRSVGGPLAQGGELPASCMGHYCNGRFSVVLPDRRSYIAGDLVYGPSGSQPYNFRDSILHTTENTQILGGKAFSVPLNAGKINAMFSTAIPDTSLGQGPLQIGTKKGVFAVNLPLDSNQWTTTQMPTSVVSLPSYGPLSQSCVATVNADAWYRGIDGIRSFAVARRDFNTWVQTALSFEMEAILPFDTQPLLGWCSSVSFDNRLLMTCSPYNVAERGVAHRGLVALDFNNVSSISVRSQPDYDGLWTGIPILKVLVGEFDGVERCFAFALDADNKICLYEILPTSTSLNFDWDGSEDVLTESWFISNSQFGRFALPPVVRLPQKKLICADMFFSEMAGNIAFDVKYRSDQYPFWRDWKTFSVCATATECPDGETCEQPQEVQRQYATFKRLPEPSDECYSLTGRLYRTGYGFQVRVQWTGRAKIERMMNWATPLPETIPGCPVNGECKISKGCTEDYFTYSIED